MEYIIKQCKPESQKTHCLVIGITEGSRLQPSAKQIDALTGGKITAVLKQGDFKGQIGQSLMLYHLPGLAAARVLLVGCGKAKNTSATDFKKIYAHLTTALDNSKISDATVLLNDVQVKSWDAAWHLKQAILAIEDVLYRFTLIKHKKSTNLHPLKKIVFDLPKGQNQKSLTTVAKQTQALVTGINKTRDLGNLPGNLCTPSYLAKSAKALEKNNTKVKVTVLSEANARKLGMGAFLSVSQGSEQPGKIAVIEYMNGKKGQKPAVLVGKGVTFDTGGTSIKPAPNMDEMKFDMCGAASVVGTLTACINMKLPVNVVGIIACAENMPSGLATRPGDVVTTMSGQTVEILNTDAEGRLVLCDALTYAGKFKPAVVIDIATLTGACVMALGRVPSGLFSNDDKLAEHLRIAGDESHDRVWRLPIWDDYQGVLKSNFADLPNMGTAGREAGATVAACFLSRFTEDYRWAHIDIAGTAWKSGAEKGATGRPVSLLVQYLIDHHSKK